MTAEDIALAQKGQAAFARLLESVQPMITAVIHKYDLPCHTAEDKRQIAAARLWTFLQSYRRNPDDFYRLFRCSLNRCYIDLLRKNTGYRLRKTEKRSSKKILMADAIGEDHRKPSFDLVDQHTAIDDVDLDDLLETLYQRIPDDTKKIVEMLIEGRSYAEIGGEMGLHDVGLRSRLKTVRRHHGEWLLKQIGKIKKEAERGEGNKKS